MDRFSFSATKNGATDVAKFVEVCGNSMLGRAHEEDIYKVLITITGTYPFNPSIVDVGS